MSIKFSSVTLTKLNMAMFSFFISYKLFWLHSKAKKHQHILILPTITTLSILISSQINYLQMRERPERFIAFPFSLGCVSHASIAVVEDRPRRTKSLKSTSLGIYEDEDQESLKHSSRFSAFPKPNLSTGVNRLVKGFKSLSQLFMYEDEMEGLGMEMEIGCPTDVKHVAHIGWDGTTTTHLTTNDVNPLIEWHHLFTPPRLPTPLLEHSQTPPFASS